MKEAEREGKDLGEKMGKEKGQRGRGIMEGERRGRPQTSALYPPVGAWWSPDRKSNLVHLGRVSDAVSLLRF